MFFPEDCVSRCGRIGTPCDRGAPKIPTGESVAGGEGASPGPRAAGNGSALLLRGPRARSGWQGCRGAGRVRGCLLGGLGGLASPDPNPNCMNFPSRSEISHCVFGSPGTLGVAVNRALPHYLKDSRSLGDPLSSFVCVCVCVLYLSFPLF